ncbi:MAG TPA: hypothetical protein VGP58_16850 [Pyrinomonadaceae bacterium]|nr:hypothetical protein [Pyrinomonadaceae bacterium]
MKTTAKNDRRAIDSKDEALRRLVKAPETVNQIYELAESLYMRDGAATARMSLADIEQVGDYLRQTENDIEKMKKQFLDLAAVEGGFQPEKIPIGF